MSENPGPAGVYDEGAPPERTPAALGAVAGGSLRARETVLPLDPSEYQVLEAIQRRVLWLSTLIVHHANHVRPNPDDLKVGGHQASSASMVSILTALYFHYLDAADRVSIKPHASPAYHAVQYLLGRLDKRYLSTLRQFGGLQAYPSSTKDPDPVDFSTGSVGLGAVAPAFAAVARRYAQHHFGQVTARRFIAVIGDAELDEGNVWEAVADEALAGLGNVLLIVDLNRQSLDRVVPGIRAVQLKALFTAAGWQVLEAKYGRQLQEVFARPHGSALRGRIDSMSNEEYQSLVRRRGADLRARLTHPTGLNGPEDPEIVEALLDTPDETLHELLGNLGAHDLPELLRVLALADTASAVPTVIFAYTIKGWGLPFAADASNHSMLLSVGQMDTLQRELGIPPGAEWEAFPPDSAEGRWCQAAATRLRRAQSATHPRISPSAIPPTLDLSFPKALSTQEALGRILPQLLKLPGVGERVVTAAPDVAVSTHLSNWVAKVGVFAPERSADYQEDVTRPLPWQPNPSGGHIELGISEMNLFMLLGQLGLCYEISGQQLFPIGTVYDPFVCRGLDALIYSLYCGSKMIFAGTPSGVSLAPEGGAHQSIVTPSLGLELPGLRLYEPAFAREVEWVLLDSLRQCCDRVHGLSTYLRLSTKKIDQSLLAPALEHLGAEELRRQVLAGGYRLVEGRALAPDAGAAEVVQLVTTGVMVAEAVEAAHALAREGIAANVIHLTSADRLFAAFRQVRRSRRQHAGAAADLGHLEVLMPRHERRAPIVTVHDASAHSLSFLGSVYGTPVAPLGVDQFGQSGSQSDLYHYAGIGVEDIIGAAYLALELRDEA
ncbi:MAG TPA: 1-deoxy-D-xylulose-5-phosphate synthase N-terminal domain-containing protein [Chloroflexota bacterium]|nr:1-deoxy-D-xylulose-5-phosphate synthase N-terminal domain-containing protein [Chloroflexota bacterium]